MREPTYDLYGRYADDENAVMRKACKLLVMGVDSLEREIVRDPFFEHVIGAAVEKMAFRYLAGLVRRSTDQSGGKMITEEASAFFVYLHHLLREMFKMTTIVPHAKCNEVIIQQRRQYRECRASQELGQAKNSQYIHEPDIHLPATRNEMKNVVHFSGIGAYTSGCDADAELRVQVRGLGNDERAPSEGSIDFSDRKTGDHPAGRFRRRSPQAQG